MADQPSRVTPAEIADLLDQCRQLTAGASLDEQIAYHAQKASLLSRIASDLGTPEAYEVSADAWKYLSRLIRRAAATAGTEAGR
jgi:hypothetical protein